MLEKFYSEISYNAYWDSSIAWKDIIEKHILKGK